MAVDTGRPGAEYELVDAGDGRRLERFGGRLVDRPAPGAVGERQDPAPWSAADLRFDRASDWHGTAPMEPWPISIAGVTLELHPTETGQVGLFPEQASTWDFVREHVRPGDDVLNLFGYTGVATLVAAAAGASVVHVDASRPTTAWARRNAAASGLDDRPIRWIVDDVEAFLRREARRGRRYHGIVLDPPSYGHSPAGRAWRLEERLPALLGLVAGVAAEQCFVALTAHTPGIGPGELAVRLEAALGPGQRSSGELDLRARTGARLPLGAWARMIRAG
jgi:23S rRNA (cytosine1962-C5)-methyltransferase